MRFVDISRKSIQTVAAVVLTMTPLLASAIEFTPACEKALALSAIPDRLRADATVLVQQDGKYREAQKGEGAFTCLLARNHIDSYIPQCPDAEGADTILPALIYQSELVLSGMDVARVNELHAEKMNDGTFKAPSRAGINYMVSNFNHIYLAQADRFVDAPPHVMFYAPNVGNDDIGGSQAHATENHGMPFILDEGIHGYMIAFVNEGSDSADVMDACAGELPGMAAN